MTAYTAFIKHAEKVTKSASGSRPILKGVCHNVNGTVVATDAHRLYILSDGFKTDEQTVIDPKTGAKIDGNYPDTSRLLPYEDDAVVTFEIDVAKALLAVKSLQTAHKSINAPKSHLTLTFAKGDDGRAYLKIDADGYEIQHNGKPMFYGSYIIDNDCVNDFDNVHVQAQYLQDVFALFKDSGEPTVTVRLFGSAYPVTFKNSDVTALILPVRTY